MSKNEISVYFNTVHGQSNLDLLFLLSPKYNMFDSKPPPFHYINPLGALGSFIPSSSSSLPPDLVPMFGTASAG
jgi:hypothetical protein